MQRPTKVVERTRTCTQVARSIAKCLILLMLVFAKRITTAPKYLCFPMIPYVDMVGVTGSIPVAPTTFIEAFEHAARLRQGQLHATASNGSMKRLPARANPLRTSETSPFPGAADLALPRRCQKRNIPIRYPRKRAGRPALRNWPPVTAKVALALRYCAHNASCSRGFFYVDSGEARSVKLVPLWSPGCSHTAHGHFLQSGQHRSPSYRMTHARSFSMKKRWSGERATP